tara:strand:+ start:301 stop:606 length:306 start_codon:yes stop_codon:yes gene_type:complete
MALESQEVSLKLPPTEVFPHLAKLSITEDKPIMLDYWQDSCEKKCLIGVKKDKEQLLVKNAEEYTSPINKIFKVKDCYILITENSIYLVSADLPTKNINSD